MANKANPHGQSKASLRSVLTASDLQRYVNNNYEKTMQSLWT